jgi:L-methionine (R)-S-oxide reductase
MPGNKLERYQRIKLQLSDLLSKSDDLIAGMATINAILYHKMSNFFWVGFYFLKDNRLLVGPYQGTLACQELPLNTGICWSCINQRTTIIVNDVHKFPGHIACDPRSRSEIVVPVWDRNGCLLGVLDIDSKLKDNFDRIDAEQLETIVTLLFRQQQD